MSFAPGRTSIGGAVNAGPERPARMRGVATLGLRERAAPAGGVFHARSEGVDAEGLPRPLTRIAHAVVGRDHGLAGVLLIGLQPGGVPLARRLIEPLSTIHGADVPVGTLDGAFYRDDIG